MTECRKTKRRVGEIILSLIFRRSGTVKSRRGGSTRLIPDISRLVFTETSESSNQVYGWVERNSITKNMMLLTLALTTDPNPFGEEFDQKVYDKGKPNPNSDSNRWPETSSGLGHRECRVQQAWCHLHGLNKRMMQPYHMSYPNSFKRFLRVNWPS